MNNKRIIIVSKFFYPVNNPRSFRTTELAIELSRTGFEVDILIPNKSVEHEKFEIQKKLRIIDLGKINFSPINSKFKFLNKFLNKFFNRFLNLFFEYPDIKLFPKIRRFFKNSNSYDVIISIAVPHVIHWAVANSITNINRKTPLWIADCGDPYMGCQTDTFKKIFYFKYLEKSFCKNTDFITVPFQGAIKSYYPEFTDKIKVIPQGFRFFDIDNNNESSIKQDEIPLNFIYAGGFIPHFRDPSDFLDYLITLDQNFIFTIYTNNEKMVSKYKNILKEKLIINSYIPRESLFKKLMEADFLVNFDNNISGQLPSKLIDYGMTKKPILNIKKDFDIQIVNEFFEKNFSNSFMIDNLNSYRIENVVEQFKELIRYNE